MIKGKRKEDLIEVIKENIGDITHSTARIDEMKIHLRNHGISGGDVESALSNPDTLKDIDLRELILLAQQFHAKSGLVALDPREWFTRHEIVEAQQFDKRLITDSTKYPEIVFENVNVIGHGVYSTSISPKMIHELLGDQILYYNHDIQRQASFTKRNNEVIATPTVYRKNVKEIKELLLEGRLVNTTIAFNAAIGSSEEGEELVFDASKNTLTVTKGTRLDILDGYHRCLASAEAYGENPNLKDFKFILQISNFTTRQAQQYQAQLAKATPIPKARQQSLEASRLADTVMRILQSDSELSGRVSMGSKVNTSAGEVVSYTVLADAIEQEFKMEFTVDAREVAEWLSEFFEYLIGMNREAFVYNSSSENTLLNYNKMFVGYIVLASRMRKEGIKIKELQKIINNIDFSRDNPEWKQIGLLDNEGRINSGVNERRIADYFKKLNI